MHYCICIWLFDFNSVSKVVYLIPVGRPCQAKNLPLPVVRACYFTKVLKLLLKTTWSSRTINFVIWIDDFVVHVYVFFPMCPSKRLLYRDGLLPPGTKFVGYARSAMTTEDLRARINPFLKVGNVEVALKS